MQTPVVSDISTHGIRVGAIAHFSADDSDPTNRNHIFKYTITLANEGDSPAELVSRHWVIIDGSGRREEVKGPGVVGQTPRLEPGQSFKYQSFCQLKTNWGTMEGTYQMKRDDGETFDAEIPRFYLKMT